MAIDMTQHKCPQCLRGTTAHQSKRGVRVCPTHGDVGTMKRRYVATAPDGTQFTRGTERTYTHAVIVWAQWWKDKQWRWLIGGFCGSLALAEKQAHRRRATAEPGERVEVVPAVEASS